MQFLSPVPANAVVTQTFAEHVHRAQVNGWTNYNGGIDWALPSGTAILAAQSGVVSAARNDASGYGLHIRLQHEEGFITIYAHLMDFMVQVGQKVRIGQVIGRSDNTGFSSGPHLHFEVRLNNTPIDPAPLLVYSLTQEGVTPPQEGEAMAQAVSLEPPFPFPRLPRVRVTARLGLNVRIGPGVNFTAVGYLPFGTEVEVLHAATPEAVVAAGGKSGDCWLQIGYQQYIAQYVNGEILGVWVI